VSATASPHDAGGIDDEQVLDRLLAPLTHPCLSLLH
jgi:hypothetical protein